MNLRSVFFAFLSLALTACLTPEPQPPTSELNSPKPAGTSATSDAPKFSDPNNVTEEEWCADAYGQNAAQNPAQIAAYPTLYFAYDQAAVSEQTKKVLQEIASRLQSEPGYEIQIEGHCDERGSTEYNLALGDRRANTVRVYLEELGVPPSRLRTISYGEEKPAVDGHTEAEFALNRRVEFRIPSVSH